MPLADAILESQAAMRLGIEAIDAVMISWKPMEHKRFSEVLTAFQQLAMEQSLPMAIVTEWN